MKKTLLFPCLAALACAALADTSDRNQPINVTANQLDGDQVQQVAIYTGAVRVVQGTMEITGEKLVLSEDASGYRKAVMTPAAGKLVHFKQRRDPKTPGVEEWIVGQGDRLEYNERSDKVILTGRARIDRTENGVMKDQTLGQRITYDMRNSTSSVEANRSGGGRVTTVLSPRNQSQGKPSGTRADLNPAKKVSQ